MKSPRGAGAGTSGAVGERGRVGRGGIGAGRGAQGPGEGGVDILASGGDGTAGGGGSGGGGGRRGIKEKNISYESLKNENYFTPRSSSSLPGGGGVSKPSPTSSHSYPPPPLPPRPPPPTRSLSLDISSNEYLDSQQIQSILIQKLETLFQHLSCYQFQSAEDSLNICCDVKSSFTIYENVMSPIYLFLLVEKYYQEYQFTSASSTSTTSTSSSSTSTSTSTPLASHPQLNNFHQRTTTLLNSYLQIISDIEILLKIFSMNSPSHPTTATNYPPGQQTKVFESASLCSSLTSNFSYFSIDSVTEDFHEIQEADLRRTPVPSPPIAIPASIIPEVDATPTLISDSPVLIDSSPYRSSDRHLLHNLLRDLSLYLTIRQNLINIHLTFHLYSPLYTLESHLRSLHLTLSGARPITQAAESLFHTLRIEITCLINVFDCRFHILKGKYVGLVLSCDELRDNLITWAQLTQQQLPIRLKSPEEMGYSSEPNNMTSWDWDCLFGWMCACFRRFLAVSQLLFQDKRKKVHELLTESDVPSTVQEMSTPTLSPRASFISRLRSPNFSMSGHDCSHCQAYQHCICPNSDHRCLNHDMTLLVAAVDQYFVRGRVHFKELSLSFVCLTSDGELATAQYICPPRDQWEVINHSQTENPISRSRIGSTDSVTSLIGIRSRRNSQDTLSNAVGGLGFPSSIRPTELVVLSKLAPSHAVTGASLKRNITRDRSTSSAIDMSLNQLLEEKDSNSTITASLNAAVSGLGRRNSLSHSKNHSNNSINDLSSAPQLPLKTSGRSNSLLHPQPLVPGFSYSHNPLNIHFTSHHIDTTEEHEILRRQEAAAAAAALDTTNYDSKWIETHLHQIKSIIECHVTRRLQANYSRTMMRNPSNVSGEINQLNPNTTNSTPSGIVGLAGGGIGILGTGVDFEKKRSPICVPIFDTTHHSHQHSRGYSIIAPLPGSSSVQSTGSFGSIGESPAGGSRTGGGGDQSDLGMGFRNSLNNNISSQIYLVGVLLDRKGGEPEMKHEMITTQHVDDVGREMSRVLKNITELISGKDLFKPM